MKKTKLTNDYCEMLNDGFGCSHMDDFDARTCADCLAHVIEGMIKDLKALIIEACEDC